MPFDLLPPIRHSWLSIEQISGPNRPQITRSGLERDFDLVGRCHEVLSGVDRISRKISPWAKYRASFFPNPELVRYPADTIYHSLRVRNSLLSARKFLPT